MVHQSISSSSAGRRFGHASSRYLGGHVGNGSVTSSPIIQILTVSHIADIELPGLSSLQMKETGDHPGTAALLAALEKRTLEETHYRNGHHWQRRPAGEADSKSFSNCDGQLIKRLRAEAYVANVRVTPART